MARLWVPPANVNDISTKHPSFKTPIQHTVPLSAVPRNCLWVCSHHQPLLVMLVLGRFGIQSAAICATVVVGHFDLEDDAELNGTSCGFLRLEALAPTVAL